MNKIIDLKKDQIQCVVSQDLNINHASPFGSAQTPTLYDFPDRLDVMKFMNST